MHTLSITYDKVRRNHIHNLLRLTTFLEKLFLKLLIVLRLDSDTAEYHLKHYYLPGEYMEMDIKIGGMGIGKISYQQYAKETLLKSK